MVVRRHVPGGSLQLVALELRDPPEGDVRRLVPRAVAELAVDGAREGEVGGDDADEELEARPQGGEGVRP